MSVIWNNCLSKLENEIPASDFGTWVRPLEAIEKKTKLKLLAPNKFIIDHIKQHFIAKIEDVVCEFSNGSMVIEFQIGSKQLGLAQTDIHQKTNTKQRNTHSNFLNKTFSFSNFVEGKSNQFAKAAADQVSKNIGKSYNPLFIYGGSGLGKTHLMQALGNAVIKHKPDTHIVYLHSERFVQDMVKAFQHNTITAFKNYYRNIDLLLIDDIQFLAGKERSQEEFFHTFNNLLDKKHQVVLTCDKYPKEINGLEDRLKSRFGWGLTVAIEPPDLETRVAILIKKASESNIELPHEVAFFIGRRISSNIRELEGALRRVIANSQFTGKEITVDFAKQVLRDLIASQNKTVSMDNIQKTVAKHFKVCVSELSSKSRKQSITRPRQIAMCLARELTGHSFPEIGDAFGGRDHTTAINACKRIKELKKNNSKITEDYKNLLRVLSN